MSFSFRRPTVDDAELILGWRTKPEITRHMFTDIPHDLERQRRSIQDCAGRRDYEHFIVSFDGAPLGLLNFAQIDRVARHCVPGIYMDLPPGRRSLAGLINTYIADYAFVRLEMNKILYYIMAGNENFIRASRALKVREVGVLRDHVWKDGAYHDVHIFELMKSFWLTTPRLFRFETTLAAFPRMSGDDIPALRSPSYRLPVADVDFLLRDELRGVRFQLEYQKAELVLRDWGVRSTVVVFGSARAVEGGHHGHWYDEARRFGRIVSERGGALVPHGALRDNVIMTGGGPGIMEAANRGAFEAGAPSIGLNIALPHEQQPNRYSTPALTLQFHYFAMRKMHFAMRANALAVFPGGFGTMDEMFEVLTLVQTRKAPPVPVVLVGADYWRKAIDFEFLVGERVIEREDLALFDLVDDAEAAWESLVRRGLKQERLPPQPGPFDLIGR